MMEEFVPDVPEFERIRRLRNNVAHGVDVVDPADRRARPFRFMIATLARFGRHRCLWRRWARAATPPLNARATSRWSRGCECMCAPSNTSVASRRSPFDSCASGVSAFQPLGELAWHPKIHLSPNFTRTFRLSNVPQNLSCHRNTACLPMEGRRTNSRLNRLEWPKAVPLFLKPETACSPPSLQCWR